MHSAKFVHVDIKPSNIAFSNFFNKHIFIDFGLSDIIKETYGKRTITKFRGTVFYCSE